MKHRLMEVMQPASSQISLWMRCKICPQLSPQFSILLWQVFNIYPHRELGWSGQDSEGLTLLPCLCFLLKHRVTMLSMRVSKMAVQEMIPAFLRMRHSYFFKICLELILTPVLSWNFFMLMRSSQQHSCWRNGPFVNWWFSGTLQ